MSTTTSYDHVGNASNAGTGVSWVDVTTLESSTSGAAYMESSGSLSSVKSVLLSIPEFMPDVAGGSEFVSMSVQFNAYVNATSAADYYRFRAYQGGSHTYSLSTKSTSTSLQTVSGDKTFWGFSGSVQDIIDDLADGTIGWQFQAQTVPGQFLRLDLKNFRVQLTYRAPDTKRASILQTIP